MSKGGKLDEKIQTIVAAMAASLLWASPTQVSAKDVIVPYELSHNETTSNIMFQTDERFVHLEYNVVNGLMYTNFSGQLERVKSQKIYGTFNQQYQFKIKNGQLYYLVDGLYKKRFTGSFKVAAESGSDDLEYTVYTYTFKLGKVTNFQRSTYIDRFAKDATFIVKSKKTTKTLTGQHKEIMHYSDYVRVSSLTYTIKNGYVYSERQYEKENDFLAQKKVEPARIGKKQVNYKIKNGRIYRGVFTLNEYAYDAAAEKRYKLYSGKLSVQHTIQPHYVHSVLKVKNGKVLEVTNTEYVVK